MLSELTIARALSPEYLELIVLPTEKCNFRCTYCYEDFVINRMPEKIVKGLKILISNRVPKLKAMTISWFGGEPLLAKKVVLEIGEHAFSECEKHNVQFSSGFTTNGYLLTKELLTHLLAISHSNFQITLDGDEEWHNRTRVLANRRPTFEKIWANILLFKQFEEKFQVTLRLHLHKQNIESVKRLYARIKSELGSDRRFSVYFHRVSDLGGNREGVAENVLDKIDYLKAIKYISGTDTEKSATPMSEMHLDGYICYAAKPNSLMIRANGGIGKCTVALNDPRNDIGHLNEDGSVSISNPKLQRWFSGYADMSEAVLGCPLTALH